MFLSRILRQYYQFTLAIVIFGGKVNSKFCNGGHICSPPKDCCPFGCCLGFSSPGYRPKINQVSETTSTGYFLLRNHWLFWSLLAMLFFFCMCGCGLWKKRQFFADRMWRRNSHPRNEEERSELDSVGSCYLPPQYSRCSSFQYAPPPYSEVTSKPDLYPLVISYKTDDGKFGDNCVMVQYFRNFVVHPALGSLSGGSTVDSISSSYFTQSIHEGDSALPPSYEEFRSEERNLEVEPLQRPSLTFLSQEKALRSIDCEGYQGNSSGIQENDIQHVVVENIQQSIQKAAAAQPPNLKSALPNTFRTFKTLQNSTQSLPSSLGPRKSQPKLARPSNFYPANLNRVSKPREYFTSYESINEGNSYSAHHYSSDVILAQPQSYCEINSELYYYSSDILNNPNNLSRHRNTSYSSEDNMSQPRGSLQDFVSSDGLSHSPFSNLEMNNFSTSSDVSSLQGCGTPDSPPKATSPTGEFKNLLDKIQRLPIHSATSARKASESPNVNHTNQKMLERLQVKSPETGDLSENETPERHCLLTESAQSVLKTKFKASAIRPAELLNKFPTRSKTFYMPFCSSSLRKCSISKSSTSAPVTPVTNFPSPGSISLSFATNKVGSKKSSRNVQGAQPLLQGDDDSSDEVF